MYLRLWKAAKKKKLSLSISISMAFLLILGVRLWADEDDLGNPYIDVYICDAIESKNQVPTTLNADSPAMI